MAATASSLSSIEKEVWTSERIQKQFESENAPLGQLDSVQGVMIGKQAQVPIWNNRSGGYTSVGAAGGSLNPAQAQQVSQATYTLVYNWFQIALETSALAQAGGGSTSIIGGRDLEIQGGLENTRHQMTRQLVTNGDGKVAACGTASSATVPLTAAASEGAAYGYSALIRNWLFPLMTVDIGTTSDTDSLVTASPISAVDFTSTAPTITIGTSISTTAGTHFVYIPNPNSATAANPELNGIRQMFNTSGALGGLNPATAGQEFWQAASRDTTTTTLSLDLVLNLQRAVLQNTGKFSNNLWSGFKQRQNLYALLQNQVRFQGDGNLAAGDVESVSWNNNNINAFADMLDTDIALFTKDSLVKITGGPGYDKPRWASDIEGSTNGSMWSQGTTQFVDAVVWPLQVGMQRRNGSALATGLTA